MKNSTLTFFVFISLIVSTFAQAPDTLWTHTYNITYIDRGYCVQQTSDGGFIVTGNTENQTGIGDIFLLKTDADGNLSWVNTWGTNWGEFGEDVKQTQDGGYIIVGGGSYQGSYAVWLLKTDSNGDTLWTKHIGKYGRNEWGYSLDKTSDGGYIIVGTTAVWGGGDIYLVKTTSSGDTLWTKTFGGNDSEIGYCVKQTSDEGYIITGYTISYGAGQTDLWLLKTDIGGNIIWNKTYGGSGLERGYSVLQTPDGGYIVTGITSSFSAGLDDGWLIKTDSNGDSLWTKTFGGVDTDWLVSIDQTNDNGYILAGETYSFGVNSSDAWLIKTNSNGDTLWTKTFGGILGDMGEYVQQTSDGGYILVGSSSSFSPNYQYDVWLIRVKPNISEVNPSQLQLNNFKLFQNYPNPFNSSTKLKYSIQNRLKVIVTVYDVLGKEIETLVNEAKPAGTYELTWNADNLPSGVYFYRIKAGTFIQTKKMILLK